MKKEDRFTVEDTVVMAVSAGLGMAFPPYDLFQAVSMGIDLVDPYGYNQVVSKQTVDGTIATYIEAIRSANEKVKDCIINKKGCTDLGIKEDAFDGLSPEEKELHVKIITKWNSPVSPEIGDPGILRCKALSADEMATCDNQQYRDFFTSYFNQNAQSYKQNFEVAFEKRRQEMLDSYTQIGIETYEIEKKKVNILAIGITVLLLLISYLSFV